MGIVVPEKFYIGFQNRTRLEGEYDYYSDEKDTRTKIPYLLGFATYLEDNKKFENRKETIDSWADHKGWEKKTKKKTSARIIDNTLQEGFYIPEEVRRCGSWNGGNVVWRIVDPRGFELEISSNNLAQLMNHTTLSKGGIVEGKCKWGWAMQGGSKLVLLPEHSEPYEAALKHTASRQTKVGLKDIKMGDKVELQDGTIGIYLGKHNMLFKQYGGTKVMDNGRREKTERASYVKRRAAILVGDKQDKLYLVSEPKISYLREKTEHPYSAEFSVKKINAILKANRMTFSKKVMNSQGRLWGNEKPIMAFVKKPKAEDIQLVLLPLSLKFSEIVAIQGEVHLDTNPDGVIFHEDKALELDSLNGYYGETEKAQKGKAMLHKGIFDPKENLWGYRYDSYRFRGRDESYTDVPDTMQWKYPAIQFEGKIFPLTYIPRIVEDDSTTE